MIFAADEIVRAGSFVGLSADGRLRVERGFVRPEDEPVVEVEAAGAVDMTTDGSGGSDDGGSPFPDSSSIMSSEVAELEEDGLAPLSERLLTELTAHRTLALRHAVGDWPDVAMTAALHASTLKLFYRDAGESCLELRLESTGFSAQAPGLNDSVAAKAIDERHRSWASSLPREANELWDVLLHWDHETRQALFAHVVASTINAVHETWQRRPRALAHAARLAEAVELDMVASGWVPTVDAYLGRVTKARILQAVEEACGTQAAERIATLKKAEMATAAEALLAGTGWLPEPLRTSRYGVFTAEDRSNVSDSGSDGAISEEEVGPELRDSDNAVVVSEAAE